MDRAMFQAHLTCINSWNPHRSPEQAPALPSLQIRKLRPREVKAAMEVTLVSGRAGLKPKSGFRSTPLHRDALGTVTPGFWSWLCHFLPL